MKFHFLLSILLLVSIGHPEGTSSQSPVELILKDTSGGPQDPQILVIKEQQSLKAFYSKVNQTRRPGLAIPKVNFKNEPETSMAVVVDNCNLVVPAGKICCPDPA